jgi:AcrR family transcriptional regulator
MAQPLDPPVARVPVTKERAMEVALALADGGGIEALSMRKLAKELGVEAASLYHHVRNKDEILDGLVELVSAEMPPPRRDVEWRVAMRERSRATREVLTRHPWAVSLMASRMTPGQATLGHLDAGIGIMRDAGFPVELAAHGISLVDSYVHGFVLQEVNLPFKSTEELTAMTGAIMDQFPANDFPHLFEVAVVNVLQPGYEYGAEFTYGLDLILNGLHAALEREDSTL